MLFGTTVVNADSYDECNANWYVYLIIIWTVDTNAEHEYLYIMERSDYDVSEGGVAHWTDEPKVSLLYYIDDDWALAKEEEINNDRSEAEDVVSDNDDDDNIVNNQPLKSINNVSIALLASGGPKSDNIPLDRVELIDKRLLFGLLTTTNG